VEINKLAIPTNAPPLADKDRDADFIIEVKFTPVVFENAFGVMIC
jgi:hypothetical protein